jgi:hypothetical protein
MSFYKKLCKLYQSAREINLPEPHPKARVLNPDDLPGLLDNRERYVAHSATGVLPARSPIKMFAENTGVEL